MFPNHLFFINVLIHCFVCSYFGISYSQECYLLHFFLSFRPSRCWRRSKPNWMSLRKKRKKRILMIGKQKMKMMTQDGKKQETNGYITNSQCDGTTGLYIRAGSRRSSPASMLGFAGYWPAPSWLDKSDKPDENYRDYVFQDLYSVTQCIVWIHFYLSICQYWNMFVQVSVRRRGEMNAYFLSFSSSGDGTEDSIISPAFWSLRNISGKKRTLMWASSQVVNSLSDGIVWFLFVAWSDWSVFVAIWLVPEATRDFLDVITLAVTCLSSFSPGWLILCNAKLNKNWPGMLTSKTKIRLKYLIHETPSIKGDEKQAKKPWKTNEDDTKAELEDL